MRSMWSSTKASPCRPIRANAKSFAINEALEELAAIDERLVRVVEMRYFAGMTEEQVAEALDLSRRSVARDWEKARLFLATALD